MTYEITQEQAEAILQLQLEHGLEPVNESGDKLMLMCKGYEDDYDNYVQLLVDDLDAVASNSYEDFQLWSVL